jgi:tRNA modification GTPase
MGADFSRDDGTKSAVHRGVAGDIAGYFPVTSSDEPVAGVETIAAISTPAGEGAIALVRISGPDAILIADRIFRGNETASALPSQTQHLGEIVDPEQKHAIDQVLLSVHRAPSSYTGENVVEISCHGGLLVTARILEACFRAGARAAQPGEFTERAFLNGKMDLTQAEAVMDLIRARSDLAMRSAQEQLAGRLGRAVEQIRRDLIELLAHVEASIDFPEEGITPAEGSGLRPRLEAIIEKIRALLATAGSGRILREGLRVVIYGPANAGKSSLLNRLLGYERAIVHKEPGTTRDTIEETVNIRGIPIRLLDTAGLREVTDDVEREGIARTARSLEAADLVLQVVDRSGPTPPGWNQNGADNHRILLLNKSDLPEHPDWRDVEALRICCLSENGLAGLEQAIFGRISHEKLEPESGVAINARHHDCLRRAFASCDLARGTLEKGLAPEYVAIDLRAVLAALNEITGAGDIEDVRNALFAQFCIGK